MTASGEPISSGIKIVSVKETKIFDPADGYGSVLKGPAGSH